MAPAQRRSFLPAKVLEDRLRNIGSVIFTRDENGNVKDGHHDVANIMFIDQPDIKEIPVSLRSR